MAKKRKSTKKKTTKRKVNRYPSHQHNNMEGDQIRRAGNMHPGKKTHSQDLSGGKHWNW